VTAVADGSDAAALVARMARGDEQALAALYDRFSGPLYAVAFRIAGERADADEIVLDTFTQAWRDAGRFAAGRGSPAAWLTMICRSRALDLVRSRGRRTRAADRAQAAHPDGAPGMGAGPAGPERSAELAEEGRQMAAALETLPAPQREAIELAFYDGLSHAEIAARLDEPLGTVKTRVRLGMQKLRDLLRPHHAEAPA
jgi:RNA polymerase sigma-70 factor, ECF subfamily